MRAPSILSAAIVACVSVATATAAAAASLEALFAPSADLWRRWTAQTRGSPETVDHAPWNRFLATYTEAGADGVTRLAYGRVSAPDRQALDGYVARLAATAVGRLDRAEQLPFWINLYNALTVKVVLDHYPVASIRDIDISSGLFADGPWGRKLVAIEGEGVSLDDIEHRILRPIWRDPRIHYAVNCASIGCPDLQRRAFTRANVEALLDAGASAYVNHPRGVHVSGDTAAVSSLYFWFQEDFGGTDEGVIAHIRRFANPPLAADLAKVAGVADHGYDWSLNDAGP